MTILWQKSIADTNTAFEKYHKYFCNNTFYCLLHTFSNVYFFYVHLLIKLKE